MKSIINITSIIAIDNLPVRKDRKLLSSEANLYPSHSTGVYAEVRKGDNIFNIIFKASDFPINNFNEHNILLNGRLGSSEEILFTSPNFVLLKEGEITFSVIISKTPKGFLFFNEIIRWEILISDLESQLEVESTKLLLCFLPKLPLDVTKGVAIESLLLTNQVLLNLNSDKCLIKDQVISRIGYTDPLSDVAAIANWMFSRPQKAVYDTYQGKSSFITGSFNDLTLNYTGILNASTSQECNCYDMAAFLQYQVQYSVGIFVYFDYIKPFGYLKLTDLIGWGSCNNPFFSNPDFNSSKICGNTVTNRSYFGNHAFIYMPDYGVVADACGGPHIGDESKQQYLTNTIDKTTPIPPHIKSGTVSNIKNYTGVTSVTMSLKANKVMVFSNLLAFIESVKLSSFVLRKEMYAFQGPLDLRDCPFIGMNCEIFKDELHSDFPFTIRQILLSDENSKSIDLEIYVASSSNEEALQLYLSLGSNHQMSSPIFEKDMEQLGKTSGKFVASDYSRYIWLFGNMVFDLKVRNYPKDIAEKISLWINENVLQQTEEVKENSFPQIENIRISNDHFKVGEVVVIEVDYLPELKLFIEGAHPGLYIQTEEPNSYSFLAKKSSQNNFQVCTVNPISLISSKRDITIIVD